MSSRIRHVVIVGHWKVYATFNENSMWGTVLARNVETYDNYYIFDAQAADLSYLTATFVACLAWQCPFHHLAATKATEELQKLFQALHPLPERDVVFHGTWMANQEFNQALNFDPEAWS